MGFNSPRTTQTGNFFSNIAPEGVLIRSHRNARLAGALGVVWWCLFAMHKTPPFRGTTVSRAQCPGHSVPGTVSRAKCPGHSVPAKVSRAQCRGQRVPGKGSRRRFPSRRFPRDGSPARRFPLATVPRRDGSPAPRPLDRRRCAHRAGSDGCGYFRAHPNGRGARTAALLKYAFCGKRGPPLGSRVNGV